MVGWAAVLLYLPMLIGSAFGLLLGGEIGQAPNYEAGELFKHNVRTGIITVAAGLLTFGILALGLAAFGGFVNGYEMGVVIAERGVWTLATGLPHFLPETLAFLCFTAVGIWPGLRMLANLVDRPRDSLATDAIRIAILLTTGVALLGGASILEGWTVLMPSS